MADGEEAQLKWSKGEAMQTLAHLLAGAGRLGSRLLWTASASTRDACS